MGLEEGRALLPSLEGPAEGGQVGQRQPSPTKEGDSLVEQSKDARNIQADVFQVEESDAVLLLRQTGTDQFRCDGRRRGWRTFSRRSSILHSISRIAFSRPLLQREEVVSAIATSRAS